MLCNREQVQKHAFQTLETPPLDSGEADQILKNNITQSDRRSHIPGTSSSRREVEPVSLLDIASFFALKSAADTSKPM